MRFKKGFCLSIQDESSMLVARAFRNPADREIVVLDSCAAPGGKNQHISQSD